MWPSVHAALAFVYSARCVIDRPALDEIELLRIERAEEAGRNESLDQSGETPARLPGGLDLHAAPAAHRIDGEAGHGALFRIGLGEHAAWLWFVDARLDLLF